MPAPFTTMLTAGRLWLGPALAGVVLGVPAVEAQARQVWRVQEVPARAGAALTVLRDARSLPAQRLEAARELLPLSQHDAVRAELQREIAGPSTPAWQALLAAMAELPDAPARLFPALSQRLGAATSSEALQLIGAMGSYRTRDSVRVLGRFLGDSIEANVRAAAVASLARLSARDDLGDRPAVWADFVREVEQTSDALWRSRLLEAVTAKEHRSQIKLRDTVGQLVEALRRLHLATPPDARPELLASLLLNDVPEVRTLGFELVARELSVAGQLDGPVGEAATTLLSAQDPKVRGSAAVLVRQLSPEGAAEAVAEALAKETDPAAAADLLLAAARWPSGRIVEPVLAWIPVSSGASESAMEAAWWLFRTGELPEAARAGVLEACRATTGETLTPAGILLLSALGDEADRARIVPLLRSEVGAVRQAAGEALVWYPEVCEEILDAAGSDADLFDVACRAVLAAEPTRERVQRLVALPKPSADLALPALLRAAGGLNAHELLEVARTIEDAGYRRALLASIVSAPRLMSERSDPVMLAAMAEGAVELANLELAEGQPQAVLAVLDTSAFAEAVIERERLDSLRCSALLGIGDLEQASLLQAPPGAWLRGLSLARDTEAAPRIVLELESRFGSTLGPEQRAQLQELKRQVSAAEDARRAADRPRPGG